MYSINPNCQVYTLLFLNPPKQGGINHTVPIFGAFCADFSNLYAHVEKPGWDRIRDMTETLRVIYTMRDPIKRLVEGALQRGLLDQDGIDAIDRDVVESVEAALQAARAADYPPLEDLIGVVHHDNRNV